MTHYLIADLAFVCADPARDTDDEFDRFTDAVTTELNNLADIDDGVIDPDMTVRIADRFASVLMGIVADTEDDAVRILLTNVRCVLHAAGAGTAGWPVFKPRERKPDVRKADFADA